MSIKSLLNKGYIGESRLEKAADWILTAPRKMWLGKSIEIVQMPEGNYSTYDPYSKSLPSKMWNSLPKQGALRVINALTLGILYCIASLCLVLPLGIGLALKKIAVILDKKSQCFQNVIESYFKVEGEVNKEKKLNSYKAYHITPLINLIQKLHIYHLEDIIKPKIAQLQTIDNDDAHGVLDETRRAQYASLKKALQKANERLNPVQYELFERERDLQRTNEKLQAIQKQIAATQTMGNAALDAYVSLLEKQTAPSTLNSSIDIKF